MAVNQIMTQPMISVFNEYNSQSLIITGFSGYNDTCAGYVEAGGLSATCNTTSFPFGYEMGIENLGRSVSVFSVQFDFEVGLLMKVAYTNDSNENTCSGTQTQRTCLLRSATLRYPITLTGNTVKLVMYWEMD
jgi:hypothetical protein